MPDTETTEIDPEDLTWDDVGGDWPECKDDGCNDPAVTMLHGKFPFCQEHYLKVIKA